MYVSIDLETLGTKSECCDIIEFGAVIDNCKDTIESLPRFQVYVLPSRRYTSNGNYVHYYQGEPFAMSMHAEKLKHIADKDPMFEYIEPHYVGAMFADWLADNGIGQNSLGKRMQMPSDSSPYSPTEIVVAGKNFATFDMRFIDKLEDFYNHVKFHRRFLDPVTSYYIPKIDKVPPSLSQCLERIGLPPDVKHNTIDDALDVIRVLRNKWGI